MFFKEDIVLKGYLWIWCFIQGQNIHDIAHQVEYRLQTWMCL